MRTVVLEPLPAEVAAFIERRKALGQDHLDEVWEGVYHMAPAPSKAHAYLDDELAAVLRHYGQPCGLVGSGPFNLGEPADYRVPDRGLHRARSAGVWEATAAMVVEIVSAGDETFEKLGFYAAHGVDEVLVADPVSRTIRIWRLGKAADAGVTGYEEAEASELLGVTVVELTSAIDWPPLDDPVSQ